MLILVIFHYVTMTFFLERYLVIQIIFYQRYVLVYLKCVILFM